MDKARRAEALELLMQAEKKFKAKQPIFRVAAAFRERSASEIAEQLPVYGWFSELSADPIYQRYEKQGYGDLHSTLMTWVVTKLRAVSHTSNWFRVAEGLCYKLLATDVRGALVGDMKLPYEAFYIEFPEKVFYIEDPKTKWHEVRMLGITKGVITQEVLDKAFASGDPTVRDVVAGPRLLIEAYAEPNENSENPFDDSWLFKSYAIPDEHESVELAIEHSIRDAVKEKNLNRGRVGERIMDGLELRTFLFRFVLNLCLYLNSEKAVVRHIHADEIKRLTKGKKRKHLRLNIQARIHRLENDRVFEVGTEVSVDEEFKQYVRTEGTTGFKLTYRTMVRGHWRNQAHGVGWSQRTRRWIEPHIRGAELPTKVVGHTYKVG